MNEIDNFIFQEKQKEEMTHLEKEITEQEKAIQHLECQNKSIR